MTTGSVFPEIRLPKMDVVDLDQFLQKYEKIMTKTIHKNIILEYLIHQDLIFYIGGR